MMLRHRNTNAPWQKACCPKLVAVYWPTKTRHRHHQRCVDWNHCRLPITVGLTLYHHNNDRALATGLLPCTTTTMHANRKRSHAPSPRHPSESWTPLSSWTTLYVMMCPHTSVPTLPPPTPLHSHTQYINVLDWSSNNVVAVALGRGVYLWNANDGTCNQLTELPDEDDYVSRYAVGCVLSPGVAHTHTYRHKYRHTVSRGQPTASTLPLAQAPTWCNCGMWPVPSRSATCVATLPVCLRLLGTGPSCPRVAVTAACSTMMFASASMW